MHCVRNTFRAYWGWGKKSYGRHVCYLMGNFMEASGEFSSKKMRDDYSSGLLSKLLTLLIGMIISLSC